VAPQAAQKREEGSIWLPHWEQNIGFSEGFYFAIEEEEKAEVLILDGHRNSNLAQGPKVLVDKFRIHGLPS